jgi:hypothetical protein
MSDQPIVKPASLFPLGHCVITANANSVLHPEDVNRALARHASGDWGDVCESDCKENEVGLTCGLRLFSIYRDRWGQKFYIITEHDRSVTTTLLPEDY